MSAITKIKKFQRLTRTEQLLFLEASFYLTICTMAVKLIPFRWLSRRLDQSMAIAPNVNGRSKNEMISLISRAIEQATTHLPWHPVCLPQAITAKLILRHHGIASTLYMGVNKERTGELSAHAWLSTGEFIVTGAANKQDFTVVASFS